MAERFLGDGAATNGFGRRSLHEWEAYLFFEANIPAPSDIRAGRMGWRLSAGGVPIPPVPDVDVRTDLFTAEVDRVRASLPEEQRTLPQYAADNHESWAAYFQRRQAQRLASTNGAPMVGGVKNSEGRRLWLGVPGRMLHEVLQYLKGGNDPPLAYPVAAAAPVPSRSAGQWMPRRFGSSSSSSSHSSRSSSHSSGSPPVFDVKDKPATKTPLGRRTRSAGIVINEGSGRASSSAPRYVKPKTEPGLAAVKTELGLACDIKEDLDDAAALKWAREDWARTELERQCRGRDEGGVVVLNDSDDDAPPPPVR